MAQRKKIAIVVQRYGEEVNGGAEQHVRRIAERLIEWYDISVITTTARELDWNSFYQEGETNLNGVSIYRFKCNKNTHKNPIGDAEMMKRMMSNEVDEKIVNNFIETKGPNSPDLIRFIEKNKDNYNAFLFVTYLFYQTVRGIPLVKEKAIFLPTAHDEPSVYFHDVYSQVFCNVKDILFNSYEEQQLVHRIYRNDNIRNMVVGEGVDTPEKLDSKAFKEKSNIKNYIIYVGRISRDKQCDILINYFNIYKKKNPSDLKLVMVGRSSIQTDNKDIYFTGFVSDQEKFDAIAGAKLLVMPSMYESLCMAVLEALSVGTPVVVNAKCAVIRGHCIRGNCGLYYRDYNEFEGCINYMIEKDKTREKMGKNGIKYVKDNYNWDMTINRINEIMEDY